RLTFHLRFHTHPGQSLLLSGDHEIFGSGDPTQAIPLCYQESEFWQVVIILPAGTAPKAEITYHYILREPDGTLVEDWGKGRTINPGAFKTEEVVIVDSWNSPGFYENAFYTEPFKHALLQGNRTQVPARQSECVTHTFRVKTPLLTKGQTVCMLG